MSLLPCPAKQKGPVVAGPLASSSMNVLATWSPGTVRIVFTLFAYHPVITDYTIIVAFISASRGHTLPVHRSEAGAKKVKKHSKPYMLFHRSHGLFELHLLLDWEKGGNKKTQLLVGSS
jgi:hypothetical protein